MKNSIDTLIDSYVYDNEKYIKQGKTTVAEYILNDTEACDNGWFWFLTEDEINDFENDIERSEELISEIKEFVNNRYNKN